MLYSKQNGEWVMLPAPDSISINDEQLWSSNAGRVSSGKFLGDVIAEKNTFQIEWIGLRTEEEYLRIKSGLTAGFFPVKVKIATEPIEITTYRGTLSARARGKIGDIYYFDSISVELIEQ